MLLIGKFGHTQYISRIIKLSIFKKNKNKNKEVVVDGWDENRMSFTSGPHKVA